MKVYLDDTKYLDININTWNKKQTDGDLEELRLLFAEFTSVIGELPIYSPITKLFNMVSIFENEYVFNQALRYFCLHLNLPLELTSYMLKDNSNKKIKIIRQ